MEGYVRTRYPWVSIIIPTFERPGYFKLALESVLNQTYPNLDIFVTDNSHNTNTRELIQTYLKRDKRIRYEHHPEFRSAWENVSYASSYNNPRTEYINWLMDDDIYYPNKIEKMLAVFQEHKEISLVTSYRKLIDENGEILPDAPWSKPKLWNDHRILGKEAGRYILLNCENFIGEPTTVLYKKAYLRGHRLGFSGEEGRYWILDYPLWLFLLQKADMFYLSEPLSCFRQHQGMGTKRMDILLKLANCMAIEIRYAWRKRIFLDSVELYEQAVVNWLKNLFITVNNLIIKGGYDDAGVTVLRQLAKELIGTVISRK